MKPRVLTTLLICTSILATTVTPAAAAVTTTPAPATEQTVKTAKDASAEKAVSSSASSSVTVTDKKTSSTPTETAPTKAATPQLAAPAPAVKATTDVAPVEQTVGTLLVGPKMITSGGTYGLNVHARQIKPGEAKELAIDVVFDTSKLYYVDYDRTLGGNKTQVNQVANGRLRITTQAQLTPSEFYQYAKTRLAHINLRAKPNASGTANIHFEQVTKDATFQLGDAINVNIQGRYAFDFNGDGIIGAGDVALASKDQKAAVAQKAEIKPYKHVIVLTTDGGGNPWDPNGMYYAADDKSTPVWTHEASILKKRRNTYTMDLFNNKFAMSTSAKSVQPAISAQNYLSMLHGRPWSTLPKEYQGTNASLGQEYFADFGKPNALYPSVFKVLQQNNPTQKAAAFSEWGQIVNSIVEPDAAVKTKQSASLKSFDDVAQYIGTDDFQNTSMVYMQSDYMDGQGHGKGWFNDNYWNQYAQYDGLFKKVMDKLEETGHIHDTLVIANADHGGFQHGHGNWGHNDAPDRDIFLAMGGETIDSGRRLHGGSNADITALVLNALQVPRAQHMFDSNVFDPSAFLKQTELKKKNRNVETLQLSSNAKQAKLQMTNLKGRKMSTADMRIDLAGRSLAGIKAANGVQILRQTVANGTLSLTLSFDKQPEGDLATLNFGATPTRTEATPMLKEAMAATTDGTEILVDLTNDALKADGQTETATNKPGQKPGQGTGVTGTTPEKPATVKPGEGSKPATKPSTVKPGETATSEAKPSVVKPGEVAKPETKPSAVKPGEAAKPEVKPSAVKPGEVAKPEVKPSAVKPGEAAKPETKPSTVKPGDVSESTTKPSTVKPGETAKPEVKPATDQASSTDTSSANGTGTTTASSASTTGKDAATAESTTAPAGSTDAKTESQAPSAAGTSSATTSHASSWLPQTGEQIQQWLVATGAIILAATAGVMVWLRKKRV